MADRADRGRSSESKSSHSEDKDGQGNKFANDGSFMEMFRRKMEEEKAKKSQISSTETSQSGGSSPPVAAAPSTSNNIDPTRGCTPPPPPAEEVNKPSKPLTLPFVGKRRGATPILKTGAVKKARKDEEEEAPKKDAWSQYLAEVKKYKEQSCQEENKTRPLVK